MLDLNQLKSNFGNIDFREKRPDLYKVLVPYFYEDGDMYDIFVEESPIPHFLRISDCGLTLMKLSYDFDIDTPHKQDILEGIVVKNRCQMEEDNIYLDVPADHFTSGLYQFIQTITKVSNMDIISREIMRSYFYDFLGQFVEESLGNYQVKKDTYPTGDQDLKVDFEFTAFDRPVYLFGVGDDVKASKVVITCLTFNANQIKYRSLIVPENLNELSKFNRNRLINTCDKLYSDFQQFKEQGNNYLQREIITV